MDLPKVILPELSILRIFLNQPLTGVEVRGRIGVSEVNLMGKQKMSRLYTVHDNVKVVTKILNADDLYEFMLQICTKYDFITSDMHFSIDNYGPQMLGGRYLVTKQLDSLVY